MDTLNRKLKTSAVYFVICIVIAIALPIMLKNALACTVGIAGALLFGYNAFTCYKVIKSGGYVTVIAVCNSVSKGKIGSAVYSKVCRFKPLAVSENVEINGEIELQIVKEKAVESLDKYRKKGAESSIQKGNLYELVFVKSALGNDLTDAEKYNNAAFVDWSYVNYDEFMESLGEPSDEDDADDEDFEAEE